MMSFLTLANSTEIKVDNEIRICQERPFSEEELTFALNQLKAGKTPGPDGLSAEFYRKFWNELSAPFHNMITETYQHKLLPNPLRRGIINLIPKPGKDSRKIEQLRPITLLSADYKILEKAISNRLLVSYEKIISEDQKGFLPQK